MPKPDDFRHSNELDRDMGIEMEYSVTSELTLTSKLRSRLEMAGLRVVPAGASASGLFTSNGARVYVDGSNLEYAGPEGSGPFETALTDHAGAKIISRVHHVASREFDVPVPPPLRLTGAHVFTKEGREQGVVTKGKHENHITPTPTKDEREAMQSALVGHLATRSVWAGNGFVSYSYQMSQKASGIGETLVAGYGSRTRQGEKPMVGILIDVKDKAPDGWAIAEVRFADAHMFPMMTFLSVATDSLTLRLIEQGFINPNNASHFGLRKPLHVMRMLNGDISQFNKRKYELLSGEKITATALQTRLAERAMYMAVQRPLPADEVFAAEQWYKLCKLMSDPYITDDNFAGAARTVEWAAKYHAMKRRIRGRINVQNFDAVRFELNWASLGPQSYGLRMAAISPMADLFNKHIDHYITHPPARTKAKPRGHMIDTARVQNSGWVSGYLSEGGLGDRKITYTDPNHNVA